MQAIEDTLSLLASTQGCELLPPSSEEAEELNLRLPADLQFFYSRAGGARLFPTSLYPFTIVSRAELVPVNLRLLGTASTGDSSDNWYIVAIDGNGSYLSIDLRLR